MTMLTVPMMLLSVWKMEGCTNPTGSFLPDLLVLWESSWWWEGPGMLQPAVCQLCNYTIWWLPMESGLIESEFRLHTQHYCCDSTRQGHCVTVCVGVHAQYCVTRAVSWHDSAICRMLLLNDPAAGGMGWHYEGLPHISELAWNSSSTLNLIFLWELQGRRTDQRVILEVTPSGHRWSVYA